MSIPKMTNDLAVISKLSDLPNSTEGLTADQLKAKFDEAPEAIKTYINEKLIPAIVAAQIPFNATSEINADNIDAAIRAVHVQIRDAASGSIVNGSVTKEKLAEELLDRVYSGRTWVSMNTPGNAQNKATDFPIGQIWLRPTFTVVNAASTSWTANGCTVSAAANKVTIKGNNSTATASISQVLANIGQDGDRVYVLFDIQNKDSEITGLTLSLNGGEAQDASASAYEAVLSGSKLTVQFNATWPSSSLAGGSFDIVNYAVVNINQVIRQTVDAEGMSDWPTYLANLLPLSNYTSPEEVFIQALDGVWWSVSKAVSPVERGGTGLTGIGEGELLMGSGNNRFERLEPADSEQSFLQFVGGKPAWKTKDDAISTLGSLRIATGSYTGNGSARSINLGVTPKMLHISTPSGANAAAYDSYTRGSDRPVTIGQGCMDNTSYQVSIDGNSSQRTVASVKLNGSQITLDSPYLCNRSGITYNWVAIY